MTYAELIHFLESHADISFGKNQDLASAIAAAKAGQGDPLTNEILLRLYEANSCDSPEALVDRAKSFEGLAPLRLRSQADDADPQLFRKVLKLSQELDKAFDQESIRARNG